VQRFGNNCAPLHFGSKFYKLGRWSKLSGLRRRQRSSREINQQLEFQSQDQQKTTDSRRPTPLRARVRVFSFQSGLSVVSSRIFCPDFGSSLVNCTHIKISLSLFMALSPSLSRTVQTLQSIIRPKSFNPTTRFVWL